MLFVTFEQSKFGSRFFLIVLVKRSSIGCMTVKTHEVSGVLA